MCRKLICLASLVLVLGQFLLGVTNAADPNLVGWWRLDESSGTTAHDSSGNGNDGTLRRGTQWHPGNGQVGGALEFNGSSGYVEIPFSESLRVINQGDFAITAWFKPDAIPTEYTVVFQQADLNGVGRTWLFVHQSNEVRSYLGGGPTQSGFGIEGGTWYHGAVVVTEAGANDSIQIYVDGEPAGAPRQNSVEDSEGDFYIGCSKALANIWDGLIDDVRVYSLALTQEEIQQVMIGIDPALASSPNPADGATDVPRDVVLSWIPGEFAVSHDVYLGDSFDDVDNGTGDAFRGNQTAKSLLIGLPGFPYPEGLVPGTTYYWRVDEVETDAVTRHRGRVWSFYVPSGKAYSPDPADGAESVATDVILTWAAGRGAAAHTVYFGDDPEAVDDAVGRTPQTLSRYYPGELEFDKTYYWRVDEFDGIVTHEGDIWSFTTMPADAFWAAAYYVDGSKRGASDSNPGTEARPWKTIGRGVQSLQPGDTLLIKAGTYKETVILQRSGTQAHPIRIQAYPGDEGKVVINAAEPVTNWRKCAESGDCAGNPYWEHIYVADVAALVQSHPDSAFAIRQVFQHGELLNRSRYPDRGWSYPTSVPDPQTVFTDSSVSKPDRYFNGSVCHIKTAVWQINQIPVAGFSNSTITLAKSPRYDISTRFGYYITSIVGEINEEGEWAYDPPQKKIFLWPRGDVAEDVEFSYRRFCLRSYNGTSWNVVRGLTMRNAYQYGIFLYRSNNMMIENNTIEHAFRFGIQLQSSGGFCNDNQIVRNTIEYSAFRGINVDKVCSGTNVEGNYIYATGAESFGADLMNGKGMGISIGGPYTRVYNNMIDRTGNLGIYVSGGKTISRDISYNYVTNTKLALADGGGISTDGFSDVPEKDHIHHNIIVDVFGCLSMDRNHDKGLPVTIEKYSGGSAGIFVDERGNNRIIEHNTVINSHQAGIAFHWAPGNIVRNNTLYGNKKVQIWFNGRDQPGEKLVDDVVLDNIMFATDAQQKTFRLSINYDDVHFGQSDRNYFYNPYRYSHIFVTRYSGEWINEYMTLRRWRTLSGYDANSKEFSYLDQFEDITIDSPRKSRIIYNTSLDVISIDLESDKYCDVHGNKIYGSVSLQPFESKILIFSDYEIPDPPLEGHLNNDGKIQ